MKDKIIRLSFLWPIKYSFLQDAISYVDHNERGFAFETICDHLSEYDIPITEEK
ncbi:MafI family immunity protein [Cronobacter universalis]